MDTEDRIRRLAKWYASRMVSDKRESSGETFYKFDRFEGDEKQQKAEEEHCRALAFLVHGGMFPDDWKFEFIHEALYAIQDASDLDEIDVEPDVYNADLTRWLASHLDRQGYCDEAVSEGLSDGTDIMRTIGCGQYLEKREVLGVVLGHLREEAESEEEDETA